jgi:cob(I)alamin adenosyltransferase
MTDIVELEGAIDRMETQLKPLKNFILPGGSAAAAHAHICRTVSRRAERAMLAAGDTEELHLAFINRVSDYFFVLARYLNHLAGAAEPEWEK